MESEKERFGKEIQDISKQLKEVKKFDSYKFVKEQATETMKLSERFEKGFETIASFNERENLFKMPISEYEDLTVMHKSFLPFKRLWEVAMDYDLDK